MIFVGMLFSCSDDSGEGNNPSPENFSLELKWQVEDPENDNFNGSKRGYFDENSVYFEQSETLYRVNKNTGAIVWETQCDVPYAVTHGRDIIGDDSSIYLEDYFWVKAYRKETGELLWEKPYSDADWSNSNGIRQSTDKIFVGKKNYIDVLTKTNGELLQKVSFSDFEFIPDQIQDLKVRDLYVLDDEIIFTINLQNNTTIESETYSGWVVSYDLIENQVRWFYQSPLRTYPDGSDRILPFNSLAHNENQVVALNTYELFTFDRYTGELIWSTDFFVQDNAQRFGFTQGLDIHNNNIYIGSSRGVQPSRLFNIDIETGDILYTKQNNSIYNLEYLQAYENFLIGIECDQQLAFYDRSDGRFLAEVYASNDDQGDSFSCTFRSNGELTIVQSNHTTFLYEHLIN